MENLNKSDLNCFEKVTAPNWQYFVRIFLLIFFLLYAVCSPQSPVISKQFALFGCFFYAFFHFYLRKKTLELGSYKHLVSPGSWLDISMSHIAWLYDPIEPSPLFLFVIIAVIGNGLQQGLTDFRAMCFRTAFLSPVVFILRIYFGSFSIASLPFLILGSCLIVYTYLLVLKIDFYESESEKKNIELEKKNKQLMHESENHTKTSIELKESEKRYRNILDNIEEAYFETDLSGNFTFFNDSFCRHLQYNKCTLLGMNYKKFTDDINANKLVQNFNKILISGESNKSIDWVFIRKDGTKSLTDASVSLIIDTNGKPTGFRGIARDISERKKY